VHAVEGADVVVELAVEGIGQAGVGREEHRLARAADDLEPRVLLERVGLAARRGGEPARHHRHEDVTLEPHHRGRVVGDHPPQRFEEAPAPIGGRKPACKVEGDADEGVYLIHVVTMTSRCP